MKPFGTLLLLLLVVARAQAADGPLAGKTLRLRDAAAPAKRSVAFVLNGAIDLTGVDPTQDGATVTLANDGSVYTATLTLLAAHWTKTKSKPGKPPTYRYAERDKVTGRAVSVTLKGGKLMKLSAHGPQLPALGTPLGSVTVTVDAGTLRLCARFGGKIKKDDGSKFLAAKAPAPATCGSTVPPPPVLGTQIDRDGRPGISTLVVGMYGALANDVQAKDVYNAAASPTGWAGAFGSSFQAALATWDGIDTVCGNQTAAGPLATAGRYATFASLLVDDQLYVDTTTGTCGSYFHVERKTIGIVSDADCGGRPPGLDVVDNTYSLLMLGGFTEVGDGVANDSTFAGTFPFLALPNN